MSDIFKLQYNGMTLAYPGWNGYVGYVDVPKFKTLTLYASEGGTVTASVLTGMPGDTAQITTAYDTYYRFSGYDTAGGGSLNGNVYTFGDTDADISALYKVNYFTATGGWEKGSNVDASTQAFAVVAANVPAKYATHSNHTGDIPASWYSTSNRWKPNNVSAYSITLHPIMQFTGTASVTSNQNPNRATTAISLIGSTTTQSQSFGTAGKTLGKSTFTYNKTFTTTTQNVNYGISAKLQVNKGVAGKPCSVTYVAAQTTGTWTATGIAP